MLIEGNSRTFTAGSALEANRLVKMSGSTANTIVYAGAGDKPIGVTRNRVANGDPVAVRLLNGEGTVEMVASGAIACNAAVYGTANGKVDDTDPGSGVKIGLALQAATADGDIIEVYPVEPSL